MEILLGKNCILILNGSSSLMFVQWKVKLHNQCLNELFSVVLLVPCQVTPKNFFLADITFDFNLGPLLI